VAANLPEVALTAEVRHNVLLVVKEVLNNAVKHSAAAELSLRLAVNGGVMTIEVSDNGRGFTVDTTREAGNGLRNMAVRMHDIGGQFVVRSAAAQGATVCLRLPLPANQASRQAHPIRLGDAGGGESG
jgi:signal transduction histidine kinase